MSWNQNWERPIDPADCEPEPDVTDTRAPGTQETSPA